jgi:hypothetical protein
LHAELDLVLLLLLLLLLLLQGIRVGSLHRL